MLPRSTATVPLVAWLSPEAMRSSVLLPQPDGPTTVTNSPGADVERGLAEGVGAVGEDHRHAVETQRRSSPYVAHRRSTVAAAGQLSSGISETLAQCITIPPVTFIAWPVQ